MVQLLFLCFLRCEVLLERIGCPSALASPVARGGLAPLSDALDMGRAAEGIMVVGVLPPTALAGRFCWPGGTRAWSSSVAASRGVGREQR